MRIDPAEPRQRVESENERHALPPPPSRYATSVATEASIDASLRLYAQNAVSSQRSVVDASGAPAFNDRVMYVGMNTDEQQCDREARAVGGVVIGHGERDKTLGPDKIKVGSRVFDLATDAGAVEFALSLGLPDRQTNIIANVIRNGAAGGRDELAAIARVWSEGEKGGSVPSRLVLSGHCYGDALWDGGKENLGVLGFDNLRALAAAMPRAAAQVEDLMISACSSGFAGAEATDRRQSLTLWQTAFPHLKTAWGYGGVKDYHSPTSQQAVMHIQAWEQATRGRAQTLDGKRAVDTYFAQVQRAYPNVKIDAPQLDGNVSVWSVSQGYVEGKGP
jgi:hypothetical protein